MKLKFKSKSILALVSLLVVAAAFNTVVISSNVGSKKSQLFLNGISSFCQNWNDYAPWMEGEDSQDQSPGPYTTYQDIDYTITIAETINKGNIVSNSVSSNNSGNVTLKYGTITAKTGRSITATLEGTTTQGSEFLVLHSLTFFKKNAEQTQCSSLTQSPCFAIDEIADFIENNQKYKDIIINSL